MEEKSDEFDASPFMLPRGPSGYHARKKDRKYYSLPAPSSKGASTRARWDIALKKGVPTIAFACRSKLPRVP